MNEDVTHSDDIGELGKALSELQTLCGGLKKTDSAGRFGKFASLRDVWTVVRPALKTTGLAITQMPMAISQAAGVTTMIIHGGSGQWLRSTLLIPFAKNEAHACGGAITYAKRYALNAICGLAEDDDDGQSAMPPQASDLRREPSGRQQRQPQPEPRTKAWADHQKQLDKPATEADDLRDEILGLHANIPDDAPTSRLQVKKDLDLAYQRGDVDELRGILDYCKTQTALPF